MKLQGFASDSFIIFNVQFAKKGGHTVGVRCLYTGVLISP